MKTFLQNQFSKRVVFRQFAIKNINLIKILSIDIHVRAHSFPYTTDICMELRDGVKNGTLCSHDK